MIKISTTKTIIKVLYSELLSLKPSRKGSWKPKRTQQTHTTGVIKIVHIICVTTRINWLGCEHESGKYNLCLSIRSFLCKYKSISVQMGGKIQTQEINNHAAV
eukprot:TRINITY_DN4074_c0_g1_i2.p1 TRINITY_DN4074_c0_g1~~TRINITY_DN4074_c0_g1_i2.p1  ORF type:complete len:103 (-),score=2.18 TRINITY_DN4074_c0_g1_i2:636-944(-)